MTDGIVKTQEIGQSAAKYLLLKNYLKLVTFCILIWN